MSLKVSFGPTSRLILFNKQFETGLRTLYSVSALGVDNYVKNRDRVALHFHNMIEKFKSKMQEFVAPEVSNMIFTEDLKHMIYLVESNEEDLKLIEQMMEKFSKQNKELRFGSFIFGPVVMRMYYYLNKPKEALKVFKNPEMNNFFDQLITFQILMDLLFKNGMYSEVLEVFDIVKQRQIHGKYPKNAVVLALGACYKMNSNASFMYTKDLWSSLNAVGHYPMRKAGTFAAALAIMQNSPDIGLEIITSMKQQSYVTVRNLKVAALADLGRPDDTFPILRSVLEVDSNIEYKQTFNREVINKVQLSVEKTGNKEFENEFLRIENQLVTLGHINESPLDELLCKEINLLPGFENKRDINYGRQNFIPRQSNQYQRPGLRDLL